MSSKDAKRESDAATQRRSDEGANGAAVVTLVDIPLGPANDGYVSRHVDLYLSRPEAEAAKRLYNHFEANPTKLADGRFIDSVPKAVRWLLQQLAEGIADDESQATAQTENKAAAQAHRPAAANTARATAGGPATPSLI